MARTQPPQQAPPEQRLRVRYAKRGRARFASHRDIGRAIERALRRAQIPMAYSSGFSPHPRISYAGASPTGAASESEYLELGLAARLEPASVRDLLNQALPDGIEVVGVAEGSGSLAELLTASCWRLDLPGVTASIADQAVAELLAQPEHLVERMTKTGMRSFDVRSAILRLEVQGEGLIEPARQGQNRVYSRRDRARLAWILRGKNVGFSLAEIKEILDLYHAGDGRVRQRERTLELCRRQIGVLTNQRNDIDATIAELQEFVAVVEGLLPSNTKSGES